MISSQLGLVIGTHFCGGEAVKSELSVGKASLDCGMEEMESCENKHSKDAVASKPCCDNHYLSLDVDSEYNSQQNLTVNQLKLVVVATVVFFNWTEFFPLTQTPNFADIPPPPLESDLTVLFQSFLL
ncbi:hypothetical protein ABHV44_13180 [Flavobacteriales bacterium DA487]